MLTKLGPIFVSENAVVGKIESAFLFPEDYEPKPEEKHETPSKNEDETEEGGRCSIGVLIMSQDHDITY